MRRQAFRRWKCRLGLHRWFMVKHGIWTTYWACTDCRTLRKEKP